MKVTKFKHAALLVEIQNVRLLVDPTGMAEGWQDLARLDGILVTHEHYDHIDGQGIKQLVAQNPGVLVVSDESAGKVLDGVGVEHTVVHGGDRFEIKGVGIEVIGNEHAPVHTSLPPMSNVGFFIADWLFHPGDSFEKPATPVEILALPTSGPWLKPQEVIDYMASVKPKIVIPLHEALHANPAMAHAMIKNFADKHKIEWVEIAVGESHEF